ncbi:hypothetical protein ACFWZ4_06880 [Frateuria sp. GZRe12]|uniref:hypothetical protein n=1 Tax=Frateuria sp. GZRe12 TaxID=3351533 RepID=UPI003EDC67CF
MKHRTAVIVAALVLLVCARMPAWSEAAARELPAVRASMPTASVSASIKLDTEWELASDLRRRLEMVCGTGRELRTWH